MVVGSGAVGVRLAAGMGHGITPSRLSASVVASNHLILKRCFSQVAAIVERDAALAAEAARWDGAVGSQPVLVTRV